MGKQNKADDKFAMGIIIIMVIVFIIFAFATLLAPIVVLVLFLVNWISYLAQDRKRRNVNFWLSPQEQNQYKETAYVLVHAENEKRKVQDSVAVHGISRNQDGQICQRSYVGKELRERENNANSLIDEYIPIYKELHLRPFVRWKKARSHYSNAFGFGFIIFVIVAMFGIVQLRQALESEPLFLALQSETVDSTKVVEYSKMDEQVNKTEQTKNQTDDSDEISGLEIYGISIGVMAGFLAALGIIWGIGWLIGRIRFGMKNPEPPLVDMDNVDTYIEKYLEKRTKKEAERQQRREKRKQKCEQKNNTKKLAEEEKICIAEQASKAKNQKIEVETLSNVSVAEPEITMAETMKNNIGRRSKEEELFITWAGSLRNEGYSVIGNWENWENSGLWKNLAVVSSLNGVDIRIVIEYYVKTKKIYFGIAKLNEEEKVSQELLKSEVFQNIITENGLTIKNNEWWYCLKFSTLDKVFQEYRHLIEVIN